MKIHLVRKIWDNSKVDLTKKGMNSKVKPPEILRAYIRKTSAEAFLLSCRRERANKRPSRDYSFEIETIKVHDYRPPEEFYKKRPSPYGNSDYPFSETESL